MYMNTVMLFFCSTETIIVREYFMGAAMVCAKLWDMYSVVISRQSYTTISKFSRLCNEWIHECLVNVTMQYYR